jgi:DNA-binding transcriptional MerR regulator
MRVGEVVERTGVTRKALRIYEARGILPPPRRTASGYRVYAPGVLDVLDFVQQGRRLGLTLAEIGHIIGLRRSGAAPCAHVRRLLTQKEADLKALLAEVRRILASWPQTDGLHAAICPHIERKGGDATWKSTRSAPRAPRVPKS